MDRLSSSSPPPPPPKFHDPFQLAILPSSASFDSGLALPLTPTTPVTPSSTSFPSPDSKPKKSNPLNDLIDTERTYVDQLTGIIRKVAAAWSRSNLPPPDLDTMFRSIEGVYKANRAFHSKLKDIGANPSSPKALGDLLMRWIDDLNGPYTTYCTKYRCGFDSWDPVQSNAKLANILTTFSSSIPPPPSANSSNSTMPPTWTLDDLFLLPKARLKYYNKLYSRLLKSTAPGKSDHKLLVSALDTLDRLLDTLESRRSIKVGEPVSPVLSVPTIQEAEDEVVIDLRTQSVIQQQAKPNGNLRSSADTVPGSDSSSARGSSVSGGNSERLSRETATTSVSRASSATLSMPISDLERRLSTQRTLDIFTMKPKVVRLQMTPPSLTFTRELRLSTDVVIRLTPQATGVEVIHTLGHIFLLSDLFLVSERMTPEERSKYGSDGADMWLCYPPLAGKVLRVSEVPDQPNALKVIIMRKETLILETESIEVRNMMMVQFKECIEFSQSLPPPSKVPPPPVPSLNDLPRSPSRPLDQNLSIQYTLSGPGSSHSSNPPLNKPFSHESATGSLPHPHPPPYLNTDGMAAESMSKLVLSPEAQIHRGAQRMPSMHDPLPGPVYTRTSSSAQQFPNGLPNGPLPLPGQQGPPIRTTSFGYQGPSRPGSRSGPGPGPGPGIGTGSYPQNPPGGQYGPPPFSQQPFNFNQPFNPNHPPPSNRAGPYGLPSGPSSQFPPRPPSEPGFHSGLPNGVHKTTSNRSLASQYSHYENNPAPPLPAFPGGHSPNHVFLPMSNSYSSLPAPQPLLPSLQPASRSVSMAEPSFDEPSPPNSPVEETLRQNGPTTSTISAQFKCKVFLQQQHSQWKSLGSARLKLYRQDPTNIKQLVVEADSKDRAMIISTIVLTDGVERVGKTGVAIELSDKGARTGIIYMIQLRNEKAAKGLFDSLLEGSDRAARG